MVTEWESGKLSDIAEIVMGQSPPGETCNETENGLPLLNGPTEFGGHHPDPVQFTTDPRKYAEIEDLLFCVRGSTTGRMNWADQRYAIGRGIAAIRHKDGKEYQPFLKAVVDAGLPTLLASATGSTFPNVSREQLRDLECVLPPLSEQKRIAIVLGALDDKIELNRRMNATLEATARALFPDSFEESPLGHIPKGWRLMKVGEFIERLPVGSKYEQKTVLPVGKVPVLDQGKSGVIGFHNNDPGITATLEKPVAVFANHTCYMRLITYSFSVIQNVLPFVGSLVDTVWAYYATEGRLSFSEYKGHWPDFVIQESVVPPCELTDAFGNIVKPIVTQIRNNEEESRTLATLRDTLLSKLLSGELSVSKSEQDLASAVTPS